MSRRRRVAVVGSGIAGLIAAIELSAGADVTLVTKSELAESNTRWAQGGIAAVMFPDDSVGEHVADTLRAGAGLCSRKAVEVLCAEGPERVRDLIRLGVAFDEQDGQLARGLEAAHSQPRVLHAQGDATGYTIEMALVRAVRKAGVTILEHTFACELLLDGERVSGLEILGPGDVRQRIDADAVILASGGAGQLYLHTTNPACATGDGLAMALRAGAEVADIEFYQFHPTALVAPETFLISEAVRGEGAVLLDAHGRRFLQGLHPAAELAPRDVVARGIAMQMAAQDGKPVLLDATALGAEFLRKRFPSIDAASEQRGFRWSERPIPVTPAAHYWMGGVRTDLMGRTSIPGLFAVGEVACTGVHGANRLASNSLLESLVFAWRCAHFLLQEQQWVRAVSDLPELPEAEATRHLPDTNTASSPLPSRKALQQLMWESAGIERSAEALESALQQLGEWYVEGEDTQSLENANLLQLGRALVSAALDRCESRGAHFRTDHPETSELWAHSLVYARRVAVPC